ncbi:MAG: PadR family transcriptional regulator [Methanobrevibacter sp.]|nr:PadR family transcriptional regulator [Candidatus Methanoflexus mossambicus]
MFKNEKNQDENLNFKNDENNKFSNIKKCLLEHHSAKKMFNKWMMSVVILWIISKEKTYGYRIIKKLNENWNTPINDEELDFKFMPKEEPFASNRIYPMLKTLETRELIEGTEELEGNRKIKYYEITEKGSIFLNKLKKIFKARTPPVLKDFINEIYFEN